MLRSRRRPGLLSKCPFVARDTFTNHFEFQWLGRPADGAEEFVKDRGRTVAVKFQAEQPPGKIEKVAVDLPAAALFIIAGEYEGAIQLEDHPWHRFKQRSGVFPSNGEAGGSRVGEEVDVEVVHGR